MESIVDKSAILRTFARVALMGVVVGLSGCSPHDVQEDKFIIYLDYGTPKDRTGVIYDYYTGISIGSPEDIIVAAADGTVDYIASSANQELIIIYHGRDEEGVHMRTE